MCVFSPTTKGHGFEVRADMNLGRAIHLIMRLHCAPDGRDPPKARVWRFSDIRNSRTAGNGAQKLKLRFQSCQTQPCF